MDIVSAILMEAFVSIHMSFFVLLPLAKILSKEENSKKIFWKLFWIRVAILLFFDIFISTSIVAIDIVLLFVGGFTLLPISSHIEKKRRAELNSFNTASQTNGTNMKPTTNNKLILKCTKCGAPLQVTDTVCSYCGTPFDGDNVEVSVGENAEFQSTILNSRILSPLDFEPEYCLPEDKLVETYIEKEMKNAGIEPNSKFIPKAIAKRKFVVNSIFSVLLFAYLSAIFFHFPLYTYVIGLVVLIVFLVLTRKYTLMKYLVKQVKARPSEKISNIVMNAKQSFVEDNSKTNFLITNVMAIILALVIFWTPNIMYEKLENGYGIRYYTCGVTNFTTATIPEKYKGEPITSMRGNTFSNMWFLKEVNLPDSITEIRGQAFKHDIQLASIDLPKNLKSIGGGAFYNCQALKYVFIPDTVTEIGGEAFYNASSLESIKLSNNITEIRGNTFENCFALKEISIPDSVTRIGGHAFYQCSILSNVTLTPNSQLREIGSSAFRLCNHLYSITLPQGVSINERAFKESPTSVHYFE